MSKPSFKVSPGLLLEWNGAAYFQLSSEARCTILAALLIAGMSPNQDGRLRPAGIPATVADIERFTMLKRRQGLALMELLNHGLLQEEGGVYSFPAFAAMQFEGLSPNATRQRKHRLKHSSGDALHRNENVTMSHQKEALHRNGKRYGVTPKKALHRNENVTMSHLGDELITTSDSSSSSYSLRSYSDSDSSSVDPSPSAPRLPKQAATMEKRDNHGVFDTSWLEPLRLSVQAIAGVRLVDLSVDQRFALARYHAWRWANCGKDEKKNRKASAKVAAGIGNLSAHKTYGLLTVSDYVKAARKVWTERGCAPWYSPWDITAATQVEDVLP